MKFKRHLERERGELGQIDIAPLIDIVFQLLIFFMLTSSFVIQPGIKINLPKAVTSEIVQEKNLIVTINKDNIIYLNDDPITPQNLQDALKAQASQDKPLLIKADKNSSLGKVVEVWDICRQAGISKINIATLQESK